MNGKRLTGWQWISLWLLIVLSMMPVVVRGWPLIVQMVPIWLLMLGQALALIAALILLAAVAAVLTTWRRERRNSDV